MKLHSCIILGLVIAVMACKTNSMMPVAYAGEQQIASPVPQSPNVLSYIPQEAVVAILTGAKLKPFFMASDESKVVTVFINPEEATYIITIVPKTNQKVACILSKGEDYQLFLENLSTDKSTRI
jgi:hypothetical protein